MLITFVLLVTKNIFQMPISVKFRSGLNFSCVGSIANVLIDFRGSRPRAANFKIHAKRLQRWRIITKFSQFYEFIVYSF